MLSIDELHCNRVKILSVDITLIRPLQIQFNPKTDILVALWTTHYNTQQYKTAWHNLLIILCYTDICGSHLGNRFFELMNLQSRRHNQADRCNAWNSTLPLSV